MSYLYQSVIHKVNITSECIMHKVNITILLLNRVLFGTSFIMGSPWPNSYSISDCGLEEWGSIAGQGKSLTARFVFK